MNKHKQATLCFLIKRDEFGGVREVCLAMKKKGFGAGKWNGVGGKVEVGESVVQAMIRETKEEIGVSLKTFKKVGLIHFADYGSKDFTLEGHIFISESWEGEPTESDEMAPKWFKIGEIPYDQMWVDDQYWLPQVLEGKTVEASFWFGKDGGEIVRSDIKFT